MTVLNEEPDKLIEKFGGDILVQEQTNLEKKYDEL